MQTPERFLVFALGLAFAAFVAVSAVAAIGDAFGRVNAAFEQTAKGAE